MSKIPEVIQHLITMKIILITSHENAPTSYIILKLLKLSATIVNFIKFGTQDLLSHFLNFKCMKFKNIAEHVMGSTACKNPDFYVY